MEEMKTYIGVKIVEATPMTRGVFCDYMRRLLENEDPDEPGYLVRYPDGYESWCPKKQFEEANRPCDFDSDLAIEAARGGVKVLETLKAYPERDSVVVICNQGQDPKDWFYAIPAGKEEDQEED